MNARISERLLLIGVMARLLEGRRHVFVGGNAAVSAAATLLARALSNGRMDVTMLGDNRYWYSNDDFGEVFHDAANGRYDATFFGGGQIDGQANINLVGIGEHGHFDVRWPGSRGTPMLYMAIPNTILFSTDHTLRAMVERVSFISAPGTSPPGVWRPGGASSLVTPRCLFSFDKEAGRFTLQSVHPGHDAEEVRAHTGFDYDTAETLGTTPPPSEHMLDALESQVCGDLDAVYPQFAQRLRGELREARGVQA